MIEPNDLLAGYPVIFGEFSPHMNPGDEELRLAALQSRGYTPFVAECGIYPLPDFHVCGSPDCGICVSEANRLANETLTSTEFSAMLLRDIPEIGISPFVAAYKALANNPTLFAQKIWLDDHTFMSTPALKKAITDYSHYSQKYGLAARFEIENRRHAFDTRFRLKGWDSATPNDDETMWTYGTSPLTRQWNETLIPIKTWDIPEEPLTDLDMKKVREDILQRLFQQSYAMDNYFFKNTTESSRCDPWTESSAGGEIPGMTFDYLGDLYAVGDFTSMGGVANTARIAKWNGSAWSKPGCNQTGRITADQALQSVSQNPTEAAYQAVKAKSYSGYNKDEFPADPGVHRFARIAGDSYAFPVTQIIVENKIGMASCPGLGDWPRPQGMTVQAMTPLPISEINIELCFYDPQANNQFTFYGERSTLTMRGSIRDIQVHANGVTLLLHAFGDIESKYFLYQSRISRQCDHWLALNRDVP